jgi:hypothetical protein
MGGVAGPPGAIAGAVIGGIVGALAAGVLDKRDAERAVVDRELDRELDREIGVSGGELGAPNLEHPPATRGVYSVASSGASPSSDSAPAEGPMQPPDS